MKIHTYSTQITFKDQLKGFVKRLLRELPIFLIIFTFIFLLAFLAFKQADHRMDLRQQQLKHLVYERWTKNKRI